MPLSVVASSAGTTTAALPTGSASGDLVVVFAYSTSATIPTLPASWTDIGSTGTAPALRIQYRVYDGVWTMPTFTSALATHAVTLRGQATTTPAGTPVFASVTAASLTWAALTTGAGSYTLRGGVSARGDLAPPTPASHTLIANTPAGGAGLPSYLSVYSTAQSPASATSTLSRSDLTSTGQVEILPLITLRPRRPLVVRQAVNRAGIF